MMYNIVAFREAIKKEVPGLYAADDAEFLRGVEAGQCSLPIAFDTSMVTSIPTGSIRLGVGNGLKACGYRVEFDNHNRRLLVTNPETQKTVVVVFDKMYGGQQYCGFIR